VNHSFHFIAISVGACSHCGTPGQGSCQVAEVRRPEELASVDVLLDGPACFVPGPAGAAWQVLPTVGVAARRSGPPSNGEPGMIMVTI
jgi:hypothetical protein